MTDKEIYLGLVEETLDVFSLTDDEKNTFELQALGILPLHGVIYSVLDLIKVNGECITEEDAGLVILELDYDDESDTYYVSTVDDDELFDEIMEVYEALPLEA